MEFSMNASGTMTKLDRAVAEELGAQVNDRRQAEADAINAENGWQPGDEGYVTPTILLLTTGAERKLALEAYFDWLNAKTFEDIASRHLHLLIDRRELREKMKTLDPTKLDELEAWLDANQQTGE